MPRLIHGIVAYTFLNVCEKIHQLLSSIKKDAQRRKFVPFSASLCINAHSDQQKPNLRCKMKGVKWIGRPAGNSGS